MIIPADWLALKRQLMDAYWCNKLSETEVAPDLVIATSSCSGEPQKNIEKSITKCSLSLSTRVDMIYYYNQLYIFNII